MGLDLNLAQQFKTLQKKVDRLVENIDKVKQETTDFKDNYSQQLEDKHSFYKEQDKYSNKEKKEDTGATVDPSARLDDKTLEDVKFGAD